MTITLKNEEGEDIEVQTAEEIQAQQEEAIATAKAEYEAEKEDLNKRLAEAEEKLNKGTDKELNFKQLREKVDKISKEKEELESGLKTELSTLKKSLSDKTVSGYIAKEAQGDAELAKKLKYHYEKTLASMPETTEEEILAKVQSATLLEGRTNTSTSFVSSAGAGSGKVKVEKLSDNAKALAKRFNFTNVLKEGK